MNVTLPEPMSVSQWMEVALKDLKLCENDPNYLINMGTSHDGSDGPGFCHVCFAGAVMAKTLHVPRDATLYPSKIDGFGGIGCMLNDLRGGHVRPALGAAEHSELITPEVRKRCGELYLTTDAWRLYINGVEYSRRSDNVLWHERMARVLALLKELGV